MIIILPFDFKRLEYRWDVLQSILSAILHADDSLVQMDIEEWVDDLPDKDRDTSYDHLTTLSMRCYDELTTLCYKMLRPLYINGYDVIGAQALGVDLVLRLQQTHDNDTDSYYVEEYRNPLKRGRGGT